MFESGLEKTIVSTAIALWFAHGWYLNQRLQRVHDKLDLIMENFSGLRQYLYEIDPQFDDERQARSAFETNQSFFAGRDDMQLRMQKKENGRRTLDTSFLP